MAGIQVEAQVVGAHVLDQTQHAGGRVYPAIGVRLDERLQPRLAIPLAEVLHILYIAFVISVEVKVKVVGMNGPLFAERQMMQRLVGLAHAEGIGRHRGERLCAQLIRYLNSTFVGVLCGLAHLLVRIGQALRRVVKVRHAHAQIRHQIAQIPNGIPGIILPQPFVAPADQLHTLETHGRDLTNRIVIGRVPLDGPYRHAKIHRSSSL